MASESLLNRWRVFKAPGNLNAGTRIRPNLSVIGLNSPGPNIVTARPALGRLNRAVGVTLSHLKSNAWSGNTALTFMASISLALHAPSVYNWQRRGGGHV